jgi:hypothetical protein
LQLLLLLQLLQNLSLVGDLRINRLLLLLLGPEGGQLLDFLKTL